MTPSPVKIGCLLAGGFSGALAQTNSTCASIPGVSLANFNANNLAGNNVALKTYVGKVTLVVNVASF